MRSIGVAASLTAVLWLGGAAVAAAGEGLPFLKGPAQCTFYDGVSNDLLTGGLGKTGLAGPAPALSSPPTAGELRTLAIYNNYRALVPVDPGNGYGTLFGPNVTADGTPTASEGLVAGTECLVFAGDASGKENVTLMVQIPVSFDPADPCIVTAPSSGSRGIYGAIGTAGEWGLRNGCAVAYTDKGTGTGAHNLADDRVNLIDGTVVPADEAGKGSIFTARLSDVQRAIFDADTPDRFAFKHAHSQRNPEAEWGLNVLQSIEFAFLQIGKMCEAGDLVCLAPVTPENTIVIASSVSNGGGASVLAAEQDLKGLIDGVAVSEPNVNPEPGGDFLIQQGDDDPMAEHSRSLYDYTTAVHVYQPCASVAQPTAPFNFAPSPARCESLKEKGLLTEDTLADQAAEAQAILNEEFGLLEEQNIVQPSHAFLFVPQAIAITYANAYARAGVADNLCAYSFGATGASNEPVPLPEAQENALFATSNGIPPTGGVNVINNASVGGPLRDQVSISPSTGRADQNVDGALCLRSLVNGADPVTGAQIEEKLAGFAQRVSVGVGQILASADLKGTPAVFVTGRNDAILAPNHTSRAYYGLNQLVEGGEGNLRYYEILNAQHLDVLNAIPGFAERFVPLHHYLFQALDLMRDHLRDGTDLPPSQVVRTVPRGAGAPPIVEAVNLPAIDPLAPLGDLIAFDGTVLHIPE